MYLLQFLFSTIFSETSHVTLWQAMHYSSSDVCALSKLSLDSGSECVRAKEVHKNDDSHLQFRFHHYI